MTTLLIAENEERIRDILLEMLKKEGNLNLDISKKENIVKIIKNDAPVNPVTLRDKILELEEALYRQKKGVLYKSMLEVIEKPIIERTLERAQGNQLRAARALGINRNTIRAKIKKLGINAEAYRL
jgi:DNA-binding protein Fis